MEKIAILLIALMMVSVGFLSGCTNEKTSEGMSITSFGVEPGLIDVGRTANLTWSVTGATSVTIDNGIGSVSLTGIRIVMPTATTTYTLSASNATKTITATTQIIVQGDTTPPEQVPSVQFTKDESTDRIVVATTDSSVPWTSLSIRSTAAVKFYINADVTAASGRTLTDDSLSPIVSTDDATYVITPNIQASDFIDFEGGHFTDVTITIVHSDTSSILQTIVFTSIQATTSLAPTVQFTKDETTDRIIVATTDFGVPWTSLSIRADQSVTVRINQDVTGGLGQQLTAAGGLVAVQAGATHAIGAAANIQGSDFIDVEGTGGAITALTTITIVYTDTNSILQTVQFSSIQVIA